MMDDPLFVYIDSEEDAFFGSRKKRKRRRARRKKQRTMRKQRPKVIARKERQKIFAKKVGKVYRDIGGATVIGQAVDTLLNPIQTDSSKVPSDFEVGLLDKEKETDVSLEKGGIPVLFFVIGGVLIVGVVGLVIYKKRQAK